MGFLNLSAWRSVGGRRTAERRATVVNAQPPRYYYENLRVFQGMIDDFFEDQLRRPKDVADLYLWQLRREGALEDEARAADLADLFSYYDIEPNSLLGLVAIYQDRPGRARQLLEVRYLQKRQGHRNPNPTPIEAGLA
ncbi:MAG TPA: hypothetical protein VNK05_13620 [Chloroflexota bacterium]|nr:hypothetical protein [Chloroflexota bacterium]